MTAVLADAPALQPTDLDLELAPRLQRLLSTASCPKYIREIAPAWLAEKGATDG